MSANPELIQQARSSDPDMRQKAAYLVSHSSDAGDFPLMFELLGDKDWRVRKAIVDGSVRNPRGEGTQHLLGALGQSVTAGRPDSGTEALRRVGGEEVPASGRPLRWSPEADRRR